MTFITYFLQFMFFVFTLVGLLNIWGTHKMLKYANLKDDHVSFEKETRHIIKAVFGTAICFSIFMSLF